MKLIRRRKHDIGVFLSVAVPTALGLALWWYHCQASSGGNGRIQASEILALIAISLLFGLGSCISLRRSDDVYRFGFLSKQADWSYEASEANVELVYIESEGWYADKGGEWTSPQIALPDRPLGFYRLRFKSQADEKGYYAVFFQDETGKPAVDDVYGTVDKSKGWVQNDVVFRARPGARSVTINFMNQKPVRAKDLRLSPISIRQAAALQDKFYADLPSLDYTPPADRCRHIPRTMKTLRKGEAIRIVMLGDSIINDTNNSNWGALLARLYPQAKIEIICSVKGSTGCQYYSKDKRFKSYVEDLKPDLLMIGGISNDRGDGVNHIREVVRKAKIRLGCEVMVMSGPVCTDWRQACQGGPNQGLPQLLPSECMADWTRSSDFYAHVEKMCNKENVEYFDMFTLWHEYLGSSEKPHMWFHRDEVHANDRGKQILGRMLESYFAPGSKE